MVNKQVENREVQLAELRCGAIVSEVQFSLVKKVYRMGITDSTF